MTQKLDTDVSENVQAKKRFGTKAKAILAGGLVLGVGAAITLAAWTDQEWAIGNFSTGEFGIEGSTDGTTFASHPDVGSAAPLSFSVGTTDLTPGDVVFAGFAVQLERTSTRQASVVIDQVDTDAIDGTSADYVLTDAMACDAGAFTAGTDAATFSLDALTKVQYVCFKVTAGTQAMLAKGETGSFAWEFVADSGALLTP